MLYKVVRAHADDFLQHAQDAYDAPLPRYVIQEIRGYLRCGDFSRGFVHLQCRQCKHDVLVAFSCKQRGLCPSCAGRRMAAQAAHMVDAVLPAVSLRQFVLAFPFALSLLAATKPDVLRALARIHAEELARFYKASAKRAGEQGKLHTGAVTFVQRFGSSLNVHVHLHTCQLDGVFVEDPSEPRSPPRFAPAAPISRVALEDIVSRIARRVAAWLKRRGYTTGDTSGSNDTQEPSFTEQLALLGAQRGTV